MTSFISVFVSFVLIIIAYSFFRWADIPVQGYILDLSDMSDMSKSNVSIGDITK